MKILKAATCFSIAAAIAALTAASASAQEARPWLCRDKPVFSYNHAMEYQVTALPGRQWRMFFMQYSPDAAHDGFDIVDTRPVSSRWRAGVRESRDWPIFRGRALPRRRPLDLSRLHARRSQFPTRRSQQPMLRRRRSALPREIASNAGTTCRAARRTGAIEVDEISQRRNRGPGTGRSPRHRRGRR